MIHGFKSALIGTAAIALFVSVAKADDAREIKTEKGKSVVVANFVNPRPDCSSNPGMGTPLPILREKPTNGIIHQQILVTDVAASDSCPSRKVPSIALIYT